MADIDVTCNSPDCKVRAAFVRSIEAYPVSIYYNQPDFLKR